MRNKEENILRMLRLAEHLNHKDFKGAYDHMRLVYSRDYSNLMLGVDGKYYPLFPFVLTELPFLFDEWGVNTNGYITYLPAIDLVNNYALLEFFGLEVNELLHCFSVHQQKTHLYGGTLLSVNSKPKDIAQNVFSFLETVAENKDENRSVLKRRVLVEKVKMSLMYLKTKKSK